MLSYQELRDKARSAVESYEVAMTLVFLFMTLLIVVQIVSRNLPENPLVSSSDFLWVGETVESLLIFIIFLGAPIAEYRDRHIQIDVFSGAIRDRISRQYLNLIDVAIVVFAFLVTRTAFTRTQNAWDSSLQNAPFLTFGHLYGSIAAGFGLVTVIAAVRVLVRVNERFDLGRRIRGDS